jgi:hypothetical protein
MKHENRKLNCNDESDVETEEMKTENDKNEDDENE